MATAGALFITKMTHSSEEKSQPPTMLRNVGGFLHRLNLKDDILRLVKSIERCGLTIELIPQDEDEMAHLAR
jgi:hypothetical protein